MGDLRNQGGESKFLASNENKSTVYHDFWDSVNQL